MSNVMLDGELKKEAEKLYFKVYQDKESVKYQYYVDTPENVMSSIPEWKKSLEEYDQLMPVLEPIYMSEYEFNNLPEFLGY